MSRRSTRRGTVAALTLALLGAVAACSADAVEDEDRPLTVWIQEDLPDRVQETERIVDGFEARSGVDVELVAVTEDQFDELLASSTDVDDIPDVIGAIPLPQVRNLAAEELVDTAAVADVLESLGESTFAGRALDLVRDDDTTLAVPSESWIQLLLYRKDLFAEAGLDPPTSYDAILTAARKLERDGLVGFVGATTPGDAFTGQTFEHVALGNGCDLVDDAGEVLLDSPACVEAFEFYGELVGEHSVRGMQDVSTTRATYFAGRAAMLVWSTFVLDELAGLRDDALPGCPQCRRNPGFLAENSGVVTALQGPSADEPAVFGEVTSWVVTSKARTDPAKEFVEYMLEDGYEPWIAIAPEGKVPVRQGTADDPTRFSDAWASMEVGVERTAPLSEFYSPEVLEALASGVDDLSRWGLPEGQGDLVGALQGELPVATAVHEVSTGADARKSAEDVAERVRSIAATLP